MAPSGVSLRKEGFKAQSNQAWSMRSCQAQGLGQEVAAVPRIYGVKGESLEGGSERVCGHVKRARPLLSPFTDASRTAMVGTLGWTDREGGESS